MQIKANQLAKHLQGGDFAAVYLVTGDEQLLVDEACAEIFNAARRDGFDERTLFEALPRAAWKDLFAAAANMSLFASKRLLDVRIPPRGLDRAGSDALRGYLASPLADTLMVCRAVGLEWRQRSSAWYKALDKAGVLLPIWPVSLRELPRWLDERCKRHGLTLERDAIDALADRVEGNLLAAHQEIEKLKLLQPSGTVSASDVAQAVGDSAHFDTFALIDAAFAGQGTRVRKMLTALRLQGAVVFMVLGALTNQLRRAHELSVGAKPRLTANRQRLVANAVRRLGTHGIDDLFRDCALLDMQAKGMLRGDAWQSLERILLALAGAPTSSSPRPSLEQEVAVRRL